MIKKLYSFVENFFVREDYRYIKNFLTYFWIIIIFSYIIYISTKQPYKIFEIINQINLATGILPLICIIFGKIIMIFLVYMTLEGYNEKCSKFFSWQAYSFSNIAKYVPGGIWSILGRLEIYRRNKINLKKASKILIAETVLLIFGFIMTGFIFISIISKSFFVILTILLIFGLIFHYILKIFFPKFSMRIRYFIGFMTLLACITFGYSFALLTKLFILEKVWVIGQFNIAFALGQLAIFAPSGIGIREIVIGYFLNQNLVIMPSEIMQIAIWHRFIWLVADLLFIFPLLILKFIKPIKYFL